MSIDIVDDLHHAEHRIAEVEAAFTRALAAIDTLIAVWKDDPLRVAENPIWFRDRMREVVTEAQPVLADSYCRASCHGTFDQPPDHTDERGTVWEGRACDPECGCPCH